MGTLVSNPTAAAAFDGQVHKKGLDLARSVIMRELGTEVALGTTTFNGGSIVSRNAAGYIIAATGNDTYGVAKWGKNTFGTSVNVDEAIVLTGIVTPTNLARPNISQLTVRSAPGMAGTVYTEGAGNDYLENTVNGTVLRDAATTIADGATVYCTYTYALADADFDFDGRFWQNQPADRTAYQEGRITVITDWSRLFTTEWVTGDGLAAAVNSTYTLTGANSQLYCSTGGKFTNDPAGAVDRVGKVYQLPTQQDPFMGVTIHGNPL
jgi:hypothetical protein